MDVRVIIGIVLLVGVSGCLTSVPEGAPAEPITNVVELSDTPVSSVNVSSQQTVQVVTANGETNAMYRSSVDKLVTGLERRGVSVNVSDQNSFDEPSPNGTVTVYVSSESETIPYVTERMNEEFDVSEDTGVIQSAIDRRGEEVLIIHGGEWGIRKAIDGVIAAQSIDLTAPQVTVTAMFSEVSGVYESAPSGVPVDVIQSENDTIVLGFVEPNGLSNVRYGENVTVTARETADTYPSVTGSNASDYDLVSVIEVKPDSENDQEVTRNNKTVGEEKMNKTSDVEENEDSGFIDGAVSGVKETLDRIDEVTGRLKELVGRI